MIFFEGKVKKELMLMSKSSPWTVFRRGAIRCDGRDDHLEMLKALNELPSNPGGKIVVLEGKFDFFTTGYSEVVIGKNNVVIEGQGPSSEIYIDRTAQITGSVFKLNGVVGSRLKGFVIDASNAWLQSRGLIWLLGADDTIVEDVKIDATQTSHLTLAGIWGDGDANVCDGLTVRRVNIIGAGTDASNTIQNKIRLLNCKNVMIDDCLFYHPTPRTPHDYVVYVHICLEGGERITVKGSRFFNAGIYDIINHGVLYGDYIGNYFQGSAANAISLYGGYWSAPERGTTKHCTVVGNKVKSGGHGLIACSPAQHIAIVGNTVEGCNVTSEGGIEIENGHATSAPEQKCENITVVGNEVSNCYWGIYTRTHYGYSAPKNVMFEGNTIEGCTVGMNIAEGDQISVGLNQINNCGTEIAIGGGVTNLKKCPQM